MSVTKYGISFEIPKGWISLTRNDVLRGQGENPFLDEAATRFGMTRDQLTRLLRRYVQTMSFSNEGPDHGLVDTISSVGQNGDLSDDDLRRQLAVAGASTGPPRHSTTPAGEVTLINTLLESKSGLAARGVVLSVQTGDATVVITATSSSSERAGQLANLILGSLRQIPSASSS